MKRGLVLLATLCLAASAAAQWITFERTYGGVYSDVAGSVQQTTDGGYIVAGGTYSYGAGDYDFWLMKTDSAGGVEWDATYGWFDFDIAYSVEQTTDGGYIVAGYTTMYGGAGWGDFWLIKTNSQGDIVWDTRYGGPSDDWARGVQQTADGGYIVAGYTWIYGAGDADIWLVKTDSAGGVEWDTTYGGADWDLAFSVEQTTDGGYIVAGYTGSYGAGMLDVWLVKTDSAGGVEWDTTYGGPSDDGAFTVRQTTDGGYIVAGFTDSYGAGSRDFWLVKTDSAGGVEWYTTYGGAAWDQAHSVEQTTDGGYIVAGFTESYGAGYDDFWLVKTDSAGGVEWDTTYGGLNDDWARGVQQTADGGYIVAGYTASYGAGGGDFYLIKTDPFGVVGVEESRSPALPTTLTVTAAPNPFNPSTRISFELLKATHVSIQVFDVLGRSVAVVSEGSFTAGRHEVAWDATGLPSGVYLIRLSAGEQTATTKVVLMK